MLCTVYTSKMLYVYFPAISFWLPFLRKRTRSYREYGILLNISPRTGNVGEREQVDQPSTLCTWLDPASCVRCSQILERTVRRS